MSFCVLAHLVAASCLHLDICTIHSLTDAKREDS